MQIEPDATYAVVGGPPTLFGKSVFGPPPLPVAPLQVEVQAPEEVKKFTVPVPVGVGFIADATMGVTNNNNAIARVVVETKSLEFIVDSKYGLVLYDNKSLCEV
jgi:hypothetical protein